MKTVRWWIVFLFASVALSEVFQSTRLLTQGAPEASFVQCGVWGFLLLSSFLVLGFDAYSKAKAEGKVVHSIWFYERVLQWQQRETRL